MTLAQGLAGKDKGNADWQHELARSYSLLGDMYLRAGKPPSALEQYDQALAIRQQLVALDSLANGPRLWLAQTHCSRAAALRRLGRHEEAANEARAALRAFGVMASRWPRNALFLEGPRPGKPDLLTVLPIDQDQINDAVAAFRRGFKQARKLAAKNPAPEPARADYARYHSELAVAYLFTKKHSAALEEAENALATWHDLAASTNAVLQTNLVPAAVALGAFQLLNNQPKAALETARKGLEIAPGAVEFQAIRALGFFLNGQREEAAKILRQNKEVKLDSGQTFPAAVLEDLRRLGEKGIPTPGLEEFERSLMKPELP
jgi:tetratricopeptide (TPR) repeat protein